MGNRVVRFGMLLAALTAAWQPSKALATEQDTQLWLFTTVRADLADDVLLTIDASQRWREDRVGGEQNHLRAAVEQRVAKNVRIGGGVAWFATDQRTEWRPHQQLRLFGNGFELRTRFEQRFFDGADRLELRLRQRLQYRFALSGKIDAVTSAEWLKILQGRDQQRPIGTQEVRAMVGIAVPLGQSLEITPAYLVIVSPRPDLPDRISHIPQIIVGYRF